VLSRPTAGAAEARPRPRRLWRGRGIPLLALLGCAAAGDAPAEGAQGSIPLVTVTATDSAFEAPDTLPPGLVRMRLEHGGAARHTATVVRLDEGHGLDDWLQAYAEAHRTETARPDWATYLGGPAYDGTGSPDVVLDLQPGSYAWVCFSPDDQGRLHVLGRRQARAFTVRPRTDVATASLPEPDATLRLLEYGFVIDGVLEPGRRTLRVTNDGAVAHHVIMFRLHPGSTRDMFEQWLRRPTEDNMPAAVAGAMAEMSPGTEALLEMDLQPADYVLVCFVAGRDEVPHLAKGMVRYVTIDERNS